MRSQPGINTRDVKSMVAFWKKPKSFIFPKLIQTNRALGSFDQSLSFLVLINHDGVYDRLVQTNSGDEPNGMVNVVVIEKVFISGVGLGTLVILVVVVVSSAETSTGLGYDDVVADHKQ